MGAAGVNAAALVVPPGPLTPGPGTAAKAAAAAAGSGPRDVGGRSPTSADSPSGAVGPIRAVWPSSSEDPTSDETGSPCCHSEGSGVSRATTEANAPLPHAAAAPAGASAQPLRAAAAAPAPAPAGPQRNAYSACAYWDNRYASARPLGGPCFDWLLSYKALRPLLRSVITLPALPVLHVGCGNSDLSMGLAEEGTSVVNTDISPVVIQQMREEAASWPPGPARSGCSWAVADCRSMPQYADGSFGAVVDKGTLDAVLCSGTGLLDGRCYISETHRLLVPGGVFVLISLGQPDARLGVLRAQPRLRRPSTADASAAAWRGLPVSASAPGDSATARLAAQFAAAAETAALNAADAAGRGPVARRDVRWSQVSVYVLPKPSAYLASEASLMGRTLHARPPLPGAPPSPAAAPSSSPCSCASPLRGGDVSKDAPAGWLGPYEVGPELEAALAAPGLDPRDFFYAYACVKPGLDALVAAADAVVVRGPGGGRRASALLREREAAALAAAAAAIGEAAAAPAGMMLNRAASFEGAA